MALFLLSGWAVETIFALVLARFRIVKNSRPKFCKNYFTKFDNQGISIGIVMIFFLFKYEYWTCCFRYVFPRTKLTEAPRLAHTLVTNVPWDDRFIVKRYLLHEIYCACGYAISISNTNTLLLIGSIHYENTNLPNPSKKEWRYSREHYSKRQNLAEHEYLIIYEKYLNNGSR